MNQSFQDFIFIVMQFSIGKIILKEKFEFIYRICKTGFRL